MENKKELSFEELGAISGGAADAEKKAYINDLCVECGTCVDECPVDAIHQKSGDLGFCVDTAACTGCGNCVKVCPLGSVTMR